MAYSLRSSGKSRTISQKLSSQVSTSAQAASSRYSGDDSNKARTSSEKVKYQAGVSTDFKRYFNVPKLLVIYFACVMAWCWCHGTVFVS